MKRLLGVALLLAVALVEFPAIGKANPPVRVAACQSSRNVWDYGTAWSPLSGAWTWTMTGDLSGPYYTPMESAGFYRLEPPMLGGPAALAVDYSNQSTNVIRSIEFGVMARGRLIAEFQDAGTFSPAAEIRHDFRVPNLGNGGLTCVPLRVTFSDGTTWSSAQP